MNLTKKQTYFDRIEQVSKHQGFKNVKDFAVNGLKYNSAEKIYRLKKEDNKPGVEIIIDIINCFGSISAEWLLTGKGEMLKTENKTILEVSEERIIPADTIEIIKQQSQTINSQQKTIEELIKKITGNIAVGA